MVGWHHRVNGCVFEQTPGVGDGQGSLACFSPWGCKESDMTEWLNWIGLSPIQSLEVGFLPSAKWIAWLFWRDVMFSEVASMLSMKAGQLWLTIIAMHGDEEDGCIDEAYLLY